MKSLFGILTLALISLSVCVAVPEANPFLVVAGLFAVGLAMPTEKGLAFMAIPLQDARSLTTKKMVAVFKEEVSVMSFLRSFFKPVESLTKEISIEVRRGTEKIAVNVQRYSDGNLNKFSNSTEKIFIPPYFYERMIANDHRLYDVAIASQDATSFAVLASELAGDMVELRKKIERAYELMCANVLELGVITLADGTVIDFKRRALSMIDKGAGAYWATGTVSPFTDLKNGCIFLRKYGKAQGIFFNGIFGDEAFEDMLNNDIFKARHDVWNYELGTIVAPEMDAVGAVYHGTISCGPYRVRCFTYPEYYQNAAGTMTPYMNPKKVVIVPPATGFGGILSFAAVPQLIGANGSVPQKGAYLLGESIDEKKTAHEMWIKSAGVPIPVEVDRIYTVQVKA